MDLLRNKEEKFCDMGDNLRQEEQGIALIWVDNLILSYFTYCQPHSSSISLDEKMDTFISPVYSIWLVLVCISYSIYMPTEIVTLRYTWMTWGSVSSLKYTNQDLIEEDNEALKDFCLKGFSSKSFLFQIIKVSLGT